MIILSWSCIQVLVVSSIYSKYKTLRQTNETLTKTPSGREAIISIYTYDYLIFIMRNV